MANGLDAQQNIFASNPDDRRAFESLEEHFFLDGDWESLADLYRARIAAPGVANDPDQQAPLLFRLGQILEERILDLEAASEVYWTLARLDPSNRPALRQLRGLHTRASQWDLVLQIAELESATNMPPYERAVFETDLGEIWHRQLGDRDEARKAYERALQSDPDLPAALEALAALHQDAGRLDEAAEILTRLTERLRGPERAPIWITLGSLYAKDLGEPARARRCFEQALDDDPFQSPAVEWSLLLAMADEDWESVSELLERRFDLASGARHRAAVAVEASQIQLNHLDSPARARAWTDRAAELAPDETSVLFAIAEVERVDGDRQALRRTLDKLVTTAGEKIPRGVLIDAAELHAEFGDLDAALHAVGRAAERRGSDDGRVLVLQADLLRRSGSKRELAEVLETLTALDGDDPGVRADRLRELARLQEDDLAEAQTAETTWRRAFELDPAHVESITALERILRKQEDWSALRAMFEQAISVSPGAEVPRLSVELGSLLLEHFDDAEGARALFDAALSSQPDCRPALAGLRRIAEVSGDPGLLLEVCEREAADCSDPDQMAELAQAAIPILESAGRIDDALAWATRWTESAPESSDAFRSRIRFEARLGLGAEEIESHRRLARLVEGPERGESLRRQAALHVALGDDAAAAQPLEQAFEEAPHERGTLDALRGVYRRLGRATDLVRVLRALAEVTGPEERAEVLEELASTLQDPIGDLETAIVVRWQLADLPAPPDGAVRKLEDLLEMAGRHAELVQLLHTRRQSLGDDSREAFELDLRRGGLLLDSLGQGEEAAQIFAALHVRHPEDERILDQLERALRLGDDPRGLCDLLEKRATWESDASRKLGMQLERASLLEEVLGEPLLACDLYETILAEHPDASEAASAGQRLESLLESSGQWQRLRDRLRDRLISLSSEDEATLRERIAAICRDRLHDVAGCAEQLEAIAEIVTDRVHVWQQLGEIYAHELDRPADWLRVVEAELEAGPSADRERSLRVAAARLCLDEDRRPAERSADEAYEHYERVLEAHPTHAEAAEVLALHYSSQGRPEDTVRILERRLEGLRASGGPEANDLRLRLGKLLADVIRADDRALPYLEAARAELGALPKIAEPLADLYERTGAYAELSALCREALDADPDAPSALPWRVRLGSSERRAGALESAVVAYRDALSRSPGDREIEDALIDLYEELAETDPLAELLEKRLPYASENEAIDLRLRLARLHADQRDEPGEALEHLEWILESHPQHRDAFERALEAAERLGQPQRTLALLDRGLDTPQPNAERAALLERRANLLADELERPEQAIINLREVLALDPSRTGARHRLRRELEGLGRWPAALDCLYIEAIESEPDRRVALLEEAAEIALSKIGPDASLPWLARLRRERPDDPELLARLADVHRRAGRFEAALRAHEEELELRTDPDQQRALHLQRARVLERELDAPARAIVAYQSALELASDPSEILLELDRLYGQVGRTLEQSEVLEARIETLGDDDASEEAIGLRQRLAKLYSIDLAKPELAIPHLEANVAAARGHVREELRHLGALDIALRHCGRHDSWARAAERELELIGSDEAVLESTPATYRHFLHEELARVYDAELCDPDRAIEHLRALCSEPGADQIGLRERLGALLRRTNRIAELADHLARRLDDGEGGASAWLELARLREEDLADPSGALDAYRRVEGDPARRLDAIRGRRRCCERLRDWTGLSEALAEEYAQDTLLDRRQRITIARTLGDVCWQRLGSGDRAAEGYQLALALDPKDRESLRALIRVREACSEHEEVIPLYRRELELLGDDATEQARRFEIWLRLASLYRASDETIAEAIEAYGEAARIERLAATDELILARLYESAGDLERFAETFGRWCDREDGGAEVRDHLELARLHRSRDEADLARKRVERATERVPASHEAWSLLGELLLEADEVEQASAAFERASDQADPTVAARFLVRAAACIDEADPDRAHDLLTRATRLDPAALSAHVALTRVASRRDCAEETLRAADAALDLARTARRNDDATDEEDRERRIDDETRLEIALLGGRAADALDDRDAVRRLFSIVLAIDPDHAEALERQAEAHFADGDHRQTRSLLERRIELRGENPRRGRHAMMIGRGLEADELLDAAWARYEEAIELDDSIDEAHEGLVRTHERAGRIPEAANALERWAAAARDAGTAALVWLRAAEHAIALEDDRRARACLEGATRSDPTLTPAWVLRCQVVAEQDGDGEAERVCAEALAAIEPSVLSAPISLRAARLAEAAGDRDAAIAHYAETTRWDPRCIEATLSRSRLVRMSGDWSEADHVLADFIDAHPDPESPALAHVHLERGRLLSGPLERFDEAAVEYERALELQPELGAARTALSGLLLHAPGRWRESLALHRQILEGAPTTTHSLRGLARLAEQHGQPDTAQAALCVLRALGEASPREVDVIGQKLRRQVRARPPMADPASERLRQLAQQLKDELEGMLTDEAPALPTHEDPDVDEAIRQITRIESELSAPHILSLDADDRSTLFCDIARLLLESHGDGGETKYARTLDRTLGRWSRRKIRRIVEETSPDEIAALDHAAWGVELRAMAAAQALGRNGGDLRSILRALVLLEAEDGSEPRFDGVEIATLVATSATACRLLARITDALCDRLERAR